MLSQIYILRYYLQKKFLPKDKSFFLKIPANKLFFTTKMNITDIRFFIKKKDIKDKDFFVWPGSWDKKKIKIEKYRKNNINYNSVFQIYKNKKRYSESDEFIAKSKIILSGRKTDRGHNSLDDLKNYFKSLDVLKNSLKKNGYLKQGKLGKKNSNDEIGVVIGSRGEIIKLEDKFGGTHRFALCKILKINNVFINVKAIHYDYIKKNIKIFKNQFEDTKLINLLKNKLKKQYLISKN
tara:strand:- start:150 stop:860 length:711 start_codon:yes stop_codon:yes gene_type:complete